MKIVALTFVTALVLVAAPRKAQACGQGGYGGLVVLAYGALAVGAVDTGLTLWDAGSAIADHHPGTGYGVFETVFGAPQLLLAGAGLVASMSSNDSSAPFFAVWTAWSALLVTHGIWTVATQPPAGRHGEFEPAPRAQATPRKALEIALSPTYAPLGQQAHPGFGLVGRF